MGQGRVGTTDVGKSKKKIKCFILDMLRARCLFDILVALSSRQLDKTGLGESQS